MAPVSTLVWICLQAQAATSNLKSEADKRSKASVFELWAVEGRAGAGFSIQLNIMLNQRSLCCIEKILFHTLKEWSFI